MSESPRSKLSLHQLDKFRAIQKQAVSLLPRTRFHLGNSAAIWNAQEYSLKDLTDVVRPGLALYGIPPWEGASEKGLTSVMTLKASVLALHRLKPGDSIGYSGTYQNKTKEVVFAAIIGGGYADGIKWGLGNTGHAWLDGKSTRFLGRVSMDLCAVQATQRTQLGSWVELIGPRVDPWAQAKAAGTIPYDLLTSPSARVKRIYL